MPYLHLALPTVLILWLAIWPLRGRARAVHAGMTMALVGAMILLFPWLWPSAYAPLALIALVLLAILFGRRRAPDRRGGSLWPGTLAALVALAAAIGAAGLVTARLRPASVLDLAPPFATAMAITEGGARAVINRHRAVLDARTPSLSGWAGMARGVTLHAVDGWGRALATPQPVLAPCAGRVNATGRDSRIGAYVLLTCDGAAIVLSGLSTITAQGAVEAGAPLGSATTLTLHAQTPGTTAHPFAGEPLWITVQGHFPVRGWVIRP